MVSRGHGEGRRGFGFRSERNLLVASVANEAASARRSALVRKRAVEVDRARRSIRRSDHSEALKIWRALVEGRWSLLDGFVADDRRYILAVPTRRGRRSAGTLTKRESQVAVYAALGESHKQIAFRLGIARSTVTNTLRAAMRKLGVSTQAQLVRSLRGMELPVEKLAANNS